MPLVRSNLSQETSALFSKVPRYGNPPECAVQRLQVPQQTKVDTQEIESLAPRVSALAGSLCTPVSEGDIKEGSRRQDLERYFHTFQHQRLSLTFGDC